MKLMAFSKGFTERSLKKGQFTEEQGELKEPKRNAEKWENMTTPRLERGTVFSKWCCLNQ